MAEEKPRRDGHEPSGGSGDGGSGNGGNNGNNGNDRNTEWDDVVLDDAFIRGADASEPSARARMLSARWRAEEPEPQPWRSDEPPAGWFFSKARRRKWRRR